MKLDHEMIASKALTESVDLKRLHREVIESVFFRMHAIHISHAWMVPDDKQEMLEQVRASSYEDLAKGKWRDVLEKPDDTQPTFMDFLESVIEAQGATCRIDNKSDLECLKVIHQILSPQAPFEIFLRCIAETAANQTLDRMGIKRAELRPLNDEIDIQISQQRQAISELVLEKVKNILIVHY